MDKSTGQVSNPFHNKSYAFKLVNISYTVRNSWSPTWGEIGYIKVLRSDDDEELCGTDVTPHDGSACDGEDEPVKVCGTCGILYDSAYPLGASLVQRCISYVNSILYFLRLIVSSALFNYALCVMSLTYNVQMHFNHLN